MVLTMIFITCFSFWERGLRGTLLPTQRVSWDPTLGISRRQDYVEYAVPLTRYSNSVTVTVYGNLGAVGPLSMLLLF